MSSLNEEKHSSKLSDFSAIGLTVWTLIRVLFVLVYITKFILLPIPWYVSAIMSVVAIVGGPTVVLLLYALDLSNVFSFMVWNMEMWQLHILKIGVACEIISSFIIVKYGHDVSKKLSEKLKNLDEEENKDNE